MKTTKKVLCLMLALVLVCALCACGISKEEVVGTWTGTYSYGGNFFSCAFILFEDGSYSKSTLKNGKLSSSESGTFEVDGSSVLLYENGNKGTFTEYEYEDGKLVNNGHEFTKQ